MARPRCDVCGDPVDDVDLVLVTGPASAFPPDGAEAVHVGCFGALRPLPRHESEKRSTSTVPDLEDPEDALEAVPP